MNKEKLGFTLIELLVVIVIIGLLSTLSILALNSARARARDAKRISDVKQIQTALELYYNDTNSYPTSTSLMNPGDSISYGPNVYLKSIPTPPRPSDGSSCGAVDLNNGYTYTYNSSAGISSYSISYCLGSGINGIKGNQLQTATPAGIVGDQTVSSEAPKGRPPISSVQ